jgi:hypothetical protein
LSFSFVAASLRPVYCTSFAQGERHPQTHHVIRYDLLNLMVKLNRLSVRLAEEKNSDFGEVRCPVCFILPLPNATAE